MTNLVSFCVLYFPKVNCYALTPREVGFRFPLVRPSENLLFLTKVEKYGHLCPMDRHISNFLFQEFQYRLHVYQKFVGLFLKLLTVSLT